MEIILSFLVSCAAGVACHYIIKWLDGDKQGQHQPSGFPVHYKKQEEALSISGTEGFILFGPHGLILSFAYGNYSICESGNQYTEMPEI